MLRRPDLTAALTAATPSDLTQVLGGGIASAGAGAAGERQRSTDAKRIIGLVEPSAVPQAANAKEKCVVM